MDKLKWLKVGPTQKHKHDQINLKQLDHYFTNMNIEDTLNIPVGGHLSDHNIIICRTKWS